MRTLLVGLVSLSVAACGSKHSALARFEAVAGNQVVFNLDANLARQQTFFDFPYPSDLRLTAQGTPETTGWKNAKQNDVVAKLVPAAGERKGFPVLPVAYFRFPSPLAARDSEALIAADAASPILLVDVDAASPEHGRLFPVVAHTPPADDYVQDFLLSVAPRPGFILAPNRKYAFVVMRSANDANGQPLGLPASLAALMNETSPGGAKGDAANALYAPLWSTLRELNIDLHDVAAATVFTTGDVVADLAALSTSLLGKYKVEVTDLHVDPDDGAAHADYCELIGKVTYPQFQRGTPPFDTEGLFLTGDDGLPVKQRDEVAPITIAIPKGTMPANGWPLTLFFHGSGGLSAAVVDRGGVKVKGGTDLKGAGPAAVLAPHGIASAGSALPVNPERLPGASETAYLNLQNAPSFRDTFRQGVIEQRLFAEALRTLQIPTEATKGCTGLVLPAGATSFKFDPDKLLAQGQSMGGMYTNLISAVEPRIKASVPTGAGGFWSFFILKTSLIPGAVDFLKLLLGTDRPLTFMHPALHLLETAWEPAEPLAYMPRLALRPLPGHPVRSIYEPVGKDDQYFPTVLYDAVALAYGHQQAGDVVWPSMQEALALKKLDGVKSYPVTQNLVSESGAPYTGVVVQYLGDGLDDPHAIYKQLDQVKYQYGCFFETFLAGKAVVPAPAALGTPCPR